MELSAFVGKLLEEQDGDALREGIRVLSQALMEAEVPASIGAERHERTGDRTAYRLAHADVGHPRRHDRAGDSEGYARELFSLAAPTAPAGGARVARRRARSIRARRVDAEGRRVDEGARARWRLEVGSLAHLRGAPTRSSRPFAPGRSEEIVGSLG